MDTNQCGINLFTILRVVLMLLVVVTGWVVLGGGVSTVGDPRASFRNAFATSATSGNPYATALFKVLVSYSGWANSMYVLSEVKNPVGTIKIAGPLGLATCGVLYILANVAYFAAATPQEIVQSGTTVAIPLGNAYNFIVDLEGYPTAVVNFLVVTGLFCLRYSNPRASRPFKVWWPVAALFMVGQAFQLVVPFLRPPRGQGDTPPLPYWLYCVVGIGILVASVVYWFIRWVAAPKLGGYTLEPHNEPLQDGTNVVVYRRVPRKTLGRNNLS
ncbi:high affinity methionine permease [Metarhizium guizhouense ARSEF 977]|uniref:High affinity methionine permease n=1 Tax=Metarhizium guizhouense (strain ARSEF 977) TaxID=1276136 RepID=A0A0B4GZW2_METGA|nr:high affinity methionine permease [Metarhizium guizhouense ARSEF 977]